MSKGWNARLFLLSVGILYLVAGCNTKPYPTEPDLRLVAHGKSDYVIVEGKTPTEAERFAVEELAEFIRQIAGVKLPVVKENDLQGKKGIYVGQTKFATENGIDFKTLGDEEWIIRSSDENLIITGGRPRGSLYAAYEFLESCLGIRFLTGKTTFVPREDSIFVSGNLDLQGTPAFTRREIYMVVSGCGRDDYRKFQVRRKINSFANAARQIGPQYGFSIIYGSPYSTHVHHRYVKDFPDEFNKPEYFALRENGTRTFPNGQVCMSNPQVRKLFAEKLREYIRHDREKIEKEGIGEPFPTRYALIPDDGSGGKCFCDQCMATEKKYGSYGGVVLEFVNSIAESVAKDYPEIILITGAYAYYGVAPKGIRARDNVMIGVAQLGAEFTSVPKRDSLRSITRPINAKAREQWKTWSNLGEKMGCHDYWTIWQQPYEWPQANIHGLAETLKFYHNCKLKDFFTEDPLYGARIHNFVDLQLYLASKLFEDPTRDPEPIIDEFMTLYYGAAAPVMKKLLNYIERRQEEESSYLASVPPAGRVYFDPDFFIETDKMLTEAEGLVGDDPKKVANIQQERLAIDETMLHLWNKLARKAGKRWNFDRDSVIKRLGKNYQNAYEKYGGWGDKRKRFDQLRLEYLRNMPPIPKQFEGKKIIDLCGPSLKLTRGGREPKTAVPDPEAATGKAWRLGPSLKGETGEDKSVNHAKPPKFGLSDCVSRPKFLVKRVLEKDEIPKDEKYHWHYVGRMRATPTMYFFAHHSWVFDQRLLSAYNAALPDQNTYDVYASLKLQGPDYVPGSKKENSFSIDRIILEEIDDDPSSKQQ